LERKGSCKKREGKRAGAKHYFRGPFGEVPGAHFPGEQLASAILLPALAASAVNSGALLINHIRENDFTVVAKSILKWLSYEKKVPRKQVQ
jgi:hypothetical protein